MRDVFFLWRAFFCLSPAWRLVPRCLHPYTHESRDRPLLTSHDAEKNSYITYDTHIPMRRYFNVTSPIYFTSFDSAPPAQWGRGPPSFRASTYCAPNTAMARVCFKYLSSCCIYDCTVRIACRYVCWSWDRWSPTNLVHVAVSSRGILF